MSDELDEDLQDLLDQLDEQDGQDDEFLSTEEEILEELNDDAIEESEDIELDKSNDKADLELVKSDDSIILRPESEINDNRRYVDDIDTIASDTAGIDVVEYLGKMDEVAEEVLQACRSDRQEAQDVINMLRSQCDTAHNNNVSPARMYIDGLVKSVEVKASINTNAVKVMEGVAKMIAATRAGVNIQNTSLQISGAELDEILSRQGPGGDLD